MTIAQLVVDFGAAGQAAEALSAEPVPAPAEAQDLPFDAMAGMSGRLAFASPPDAIAAMFPAASGWLGARRVAALAATTLLVGMVCPGLHSIYGGLTVEACEEPVVEDRLSFRVTTADPRVRLVRMTVAGGGLAGAVQSYARMPPTAPDVAAGSGRFGRAGRVQRRRGSDHWRLARSRRGDREAVGGGRRKGGDQLSGRLRRSRGGGAGDPLRRGRMRDARL